MMEDSSESNFSSFQNIKEEKKSSKQGSKKNDRVEIKVI